MADDGTAADSGGYDFDRVVGANIRRWRDARGLSQADLASKLGIHQQTIQKIEKGTRPLKYAEAVHISDVLDIPLKDLFKEFNAEDAAFSSFSMEVSREFHKLQDDLDELAQRIADELVDVALLSGYIERTFSDYDSESLSIASAAVGGWLASNWGRRLNRQIMTALRGHEYLSDIRDEFDAASYAEVIARVKNHPVTIHPARSGLPILEALKWRPLESDESDA
ncbi:hypothetical protein A5719_03300 [Mycolicibacterium peregrinum]|uniref:helix-turn-helix domain-containing protein n=1 Tax=Mycolicibacterium peregrinum TaxID=43304 RepID=UPI0007EB7823|nr:helix-turn-helix transcriptional regulator [Mycolicibacterium peregrinum]OBF42568.1 hypothetical protein A5719_03300 [Mycolicibacterium peregrinum]